MGTDVEVDEVGDAATNEAIENVTDGAAENQRDAAFAESCASTAGDEKPDEQGDYEEREDDQERSAPRIRRVGQNSEGDTGIARMHQVEHARNEDANRAGLRAMFDKIFAELIGRERADRK